VASFEITARNIIHAAAFNPTERGNLVASLRSDAKLKAFAETELARLSDPMLRERCHISNATHRTLTDALRQADMPTAQIATIEAIE
jgi:hypothetical protein